MKTDLKDSGQLDTLHSSQAQEPDLPCLEWGKLSGASLPGCVPTSIYGVVSIVGGGPQDKVIGIGARGIVADVSNLHACRYFSMMNSVRNAMGIVRSLEFGVVHHSISKGKGISGPFPTPVLLDDVCPESLDRLLIHNNEVISPIPLPR